jgi:hypothetical protein
MIRKVREALDNFDADNWSKLIEARNQLVCTMIMVALAVFAFVEFAMMINVSPVHLKIAIVFYAFGALVGLINRLYLEANNNSAIDDYNLSLARLVVAPQLSGIAAVIGVLLFQKAATLGGVFTFDGITTTLVIAATFGLAPNLLINQLKKQADGYTGNLKSTQPTTEG